MPRKIKTKADASQAKSSRAAAKITQKAAEQRRRELQKQRSQIQRENDKHLKSVAKSIRGMGIYEPKSLQMTKYRRKRLRAVERDLGDFLDPNKFFMLPIPKEHRKKAVERAEGLKIKHTKAGLIVERGGYKRASVKVDKKRGEIFIERQGKTKRGPNKGRTYRDVTPLASVDELTAEIERIRRAARRLGKLKKNEHISFVVEEDGTVGPSATFFKEIEGHVGLIEYLTGRYIMNAADKIQFLRHVRVLKTTIEDFNAKYPPKDRAKSRIITKGRNKATGKFNTRGSK